MLKINTLRDAMTDACPWCRANPEKFTVYVNNGGIETNPPHIFTVTRLGSLSWTSRRISMN